MLKVLKKKQVLRIQRLETDISENDSSLEWEN